MALRGLGFAGGALRGYRLALEEIAKNYADDANLDEFAARLNDLLQSSIIEQRKEIIMRDVIAKQLEAV